MDYHVSVNGIEFLMEEFYSNTRKMEKELKKNNKKDKAKQLNVYANRMQQIYYSAQHTDNKGLIVSYTKDLKLVYQNANKIYKEV